MVLLVQRFLFLTPKIKHNQVKIRTLTLILKQNFSLTRLTQLRTVYSKNMATASNGILPPESNAKRFKEGIKIGTHDGVFHCDEVLACYMLQQLDEYKKAEIIRTRDSAKLSACDIVVDVGAVFDRKALRFDHHQREFTETLSSLRPELGDQWKIKLSSAGLIYTFFGEDVIRSVLKNRCDGLTIDDYGLRHVYRNVYDFFIQEIDAIDNGVPMFDGEPAYRITTNLSSRVSNFNPEWNSTRLDDVDDLFKKAVNYVGEEFDDKVVYFGTVWWPARALVREALMNRLNFHASGQIIEFTDCFPWKEHLFELEKEMDLVGIVKYVVYNDKPESWRVQAVPVYPGSFVSRLKLHKDWCGVRDEELSKVSGVPNAIFCHTTGFIGGNKTKEGALLMAAKSLLASVEDKNIPSSDN